jgi:hypothetical protein
VESFESPSSNLRLTIYTEQPDLSAKILTNVIADSKCMVAKTKELIKNNAYLNERIALVKRYKSDSKRRWPGGIITRFRSVYRQKNNKKYYISERHLSPSHTCFCRK